MTKFLKAASTAALVLACAQAYAFPKLPGHLLLEAGPYWSHQGTSQTVNINGLIGDRYNVTNQNDTNVLLGAGYILNGYNNGRYGIDYGINVFYLAKTKVSGTITQEMTFTNLGYRYYVSHLPVYVMAKGHVNTGYPNLAVTVDAGIGPNFMETSSFSDRSLDGITLPDNAFKGQSSTVFSAMLGVGLKLSSMKMPIEVGYRYFYLGEGELTPRTNQILNKLKTGTNSAQALVFTVSV